MNKHMLKTSLLSIATAIVLGTVGCSSGGGSSTDPVAAVTNDGTAIDGILVGSTVCIDTNANGLCAEEAAGNQDITDDKGKFSITSTATGPLVLLGGTDSGTGQAFTGTLKAPAGSTVVTPLTSAVQSLVESGKSAADAEANVKAALGIDAGVDLVNFDPFEGIGDANATVQANAQTVLAKQTQLQVLVHTAAVAVAGADAGTDVNATMSSVFDAIVTNFDGASAPVVLDATAVATATKTVADEVYADNAAARVATKVVAASTAEDAVREADSAEEIISTGTAADAVDNLNNAITLVNTSTEAAVEAAIAEATVNANALTEVALAAIEALQDERDRLEAEIAAAKAAAEAAEAQAAADLAAAIAASDKAAYEAALLAQAQAEELAAAQALAEKLAAEAALAAAQAEADIAAALAAAAEAEAQAAVAQAAAELVAAELREAAAAQAAADAAAAADFAAAEAAAAAAQAAAAAAIAQAEVAMYVQIATTFAAQAENDANATRVIAAAGYAVSAEVAAAEAAAAAALQAASDANITILGDNNISASIAFKDEAQTQVGLAATALDDARVIKSAADLADAAAVAAAAKVARIQVILDNVTAIDSSVTSELAAANTVANQVATDIDAITALDGSYDLGTILADATTAANEAATLVSDATTLASTVATAKTNVTDALSSVDEAAAEAAEASAQAALATFTQKLTDADTKAAAVAAALVDAQAIKTLVDSQTPAPSADATWFDGKTLHGFWMENYDGLEIMYEDIQLSGGSIVASEYMFDTNSSSWVLDTSVDDDMTLNTSTGTWETDSAETYVINSSDNTIMTLNGTEDIRIDSVTDLGGQTVNFDVENSSIVVPVTFSTGAIKYNISWKLLVDSYELEWTPEDWNNNNAPYSNLEDYMNTNGHFYWDEVTGTSVQTQKDPNGAIDSNAFPIGTLTLGETGPLVAIQQDGTTTSAGTWTVINLPGQSGVLTIDTALDAGIANYDSYMRYGKALATTDSGIVRMVEFEEAMTTFIAEDEDAMGNDIAMADIKAAVEAFSFPTAIDVQAYFESGSKFFVNEEGITGERTYSGGSYTGVINTDTADINVSGNYSVVNNVMTINRTSPDVRSFELTYASPTPFGSGEMFLASENGATAIETYSYDSDADRTTGMVDATASMRGFFPDSTKYYLSASGKVGYRTFSVVDAESVPYTGTYTGDVEGVGAVSGTYEIMGDTMVLTRDVTGITTVFKQNSVAADGLSQVFDMTLYTSTTSTFVSTNYANEVDRDAALLASTWSAELGSITEAEFTALSNGADPIGTWYFVDDALNFEEISINSNGTVDFTATEGGSVVETGLIYYTVHTDATYGSVVGLKENEADTTYMEYIKFFESLDQAALQSAYSHITWSTGAAAVKNAGISNGESFDAWDDSGTFATVSYSDFASLITGMTFGNSSVDDDGFIIGNGVEAIVFATGSNTSGGDVVLGSDNNTVVGSYAVQTVDGASTLVVTITDPSFDDEHIAFQYTDIGNGTAMYRGEIYDRWSDILLNTIAKDDVLTFLAQ